MGKIKWSEKVTNEQVLERIGEKRTFLDNIHVEKQIGLVIFCEEIAFCMTPLKERLRNSKEWEEEKEHSSLMV